MQLAWMQQSRESKQQRRAIDADASGPAASMGVDVCRRVVARTPALSCNLSVQLIACLFAWCPTCSRVWLCVLVGWASEQIEIAKTIAQARFIAHSASISHHPTSS